MDKIEDLDCYSPDYSTARRRFREAALGAGARLARLDLDERGPDGDELSIDIAWLGDNTPRRVVIHTSGAHGAEGFAGSAVQLSWLKRSPLLATNCAVILVHCLNPYGMAWLRRANEHNVDLNRNFCVAPAEWSGAPALYGRLDPLLNPPTASAADAFRLRMVLAALRFGPRRIRQAIAAGQYEYPRGLFFGGKQLEPGLQRYAAWLDQALSLPEQLFVIDFHTGLGRYGQNSLFAKGEAATGNDLPEKIMRAVNSDFTGSNVGGYTVQGGDDSLYRAIFPRTSIYFFTQEIGTYGALKVLATLRAENRYHHYGDGDIAHRTKQAMREVFCPASNAWRNSVVRDGTTLIEQAIHFTDSAG